MSQEPLVPTGLLAPDGRGQVFALERFTPAERLRGVVLRYWRVTWRVDGQAEHVQETLPYPCVNVVERQRSAVFGINTCRGRVQLAGEGWACGIKFRPGAFYPFQRARVAALTDRVIDLQAAFGEAGARYERAVRAFPPGQAMVACAEQLLLAQHPSPDPQG